jgi:hypothetical protein
MRCLSTCPLGSAQARSLFGEEVDRLDDEISADRIILAEIEKPRLDIQVKTNLPHSGSISVSYITGNNAPASAADVRRLS